MKSYTRATGMNCGSIFFRTPAELLEPLNFLNEMKGGHTATQNDTRKNTRRSHTLQVRITHNLRVQIRCGSRHASIMARHFTRGMAMSPHWCMATYLRDSLIIYHTYRRIIIINDVGTECWVPYLVASGYWAANPALAPRREVPRA